KAQPIADPGAVTAYQDRTSGAPQQLPGADTGGAFMDLAKRKHNASFMNQQLKTILETPNHPLAFLVDPLARDWLSRGTYSSDPTVQAGHLTSLFSGAPERFALEDSTFYQWSSNRGESQGAIFLKNAVDIWGAIVEFRTAMEWVRAGLLSSEIL